MQYEDCLVYSFPRGFILPLFNNLCATLVNKQNFPVAKANPFAWFDIFYNFFKPNHFNAKNVINKIFY